MTPPLDITPTLLETVLKAHPARAGSHPQPAYIHSILRAMANEFRRQGGAYPAASYGDLTWLCAERIDKPCKCGAVKPWSAALAGASTQAPLSLSTQRRYIENFRSALFSVNQRYGAAFPQLSARWAASHAELSQRVCELQQALAVHTLTRELSPAEQARWVDWTRIRAAVTAKIADTDLDSCPLRPARYCKNFKK